jgi:hypothetical protein
MWCCKLGAVFCQMSALLHASAMGWEAQHRNPQQICTPLWFHRWGCAWQQCPIDPEGSKFCLDVCCFTLLSLLFYNPCTSWAMWKHNVGISGACQAMAWSEHQAHHARASGYSRGTVLWKH